MCLPKDLPEFLEIDLSAMEINDIKRLSDIPLPAGVQLVDLAHGRDEPVVSIHHPRAEEVEAAPAEAAAAVAGATPVAGAAAPAAAGAPAAGGEAKKEEGKPAAAGGCSESRGCAEEGRRQEVTNAGMSARPRFRRGRCGLFRIGLLSYFPIAYCYVRHTPQDHRRSRQSGTRAPAHASQRGLLVRGRAGGEGSARAFAATRASRARSAARSCRAAR